jgi:sugar phosphate permease
MLAVYAIVNGNSWGWTSPQILGCSVLVILLLLIFLRTESRISQPLIPLALFRNRTVLVANCIVIVWAAALLTWFYISSLSLQVIRGYDPVDVGLAFLPTSGTMALVSLGLSGFLVNAFGIRAPLTLGLTLASIGLFLLATAPMAGSFTSSVLPGMLLFGIGAGMAVNPMLLAAVNAVPEGETGLASGVVNTSFAMGGAIWLAILSSYAASRNTSLAASGLDPLSALNEGYQSAFFAAACCSALGAILSAVGLEGKKAD